jgi:nascent polypeptide-associated complex subunit alpha
LPGTGEGGAVAAGAGDDLTGKGKQSRGEKKARKIMSKLGLKQVSSLSSGVPNL